MPTTKYIWNPVDDNVIMEKDENNVTTARYTHLPGLHGKLISQNRGGVESFYHYDGEGNTRALTDINGDVTDTYDYDAFGDVIASTGNTTNPFSFKGALGYYANPETNDYYVRARNYEPTIARWLSADPIGFVDGVNLYAYVGNDPVNRVDPSGNQGKKYTIDVDYLRLEELNGCGQYRQRVIFTLTAPCDGYLVQQIDVREKVVLCPSYADPKDKCDCKIPSGLMFGPDTKHYFWEVFPGGRLRKGLGWKKGDLVAVMDDRQSNAGYAVVKNERKANCGMHTVTGWPSYFCDSDLPADAFNDFKSDRSGPAGALPHTVKKQDWFHKVKTAAKGYAGNGLTWDCCKLPLRNYIDPWTLANGKYTKL